MTEVTVFLQCLFKGFALGFVCFSFFLSIELMSKKKSVEGTALSLMYQKFRSSLLDMYGLN